MAQQLIIQNDENEDYVQFTVEIPDGYNAFNISSINGTMINQNYLNVGDVIKFKFSNNPIKYEDSLYLQMADCRTSATMTYDTVVDYFNDFKFMKLDLFNLYRVKFVPVYAYYSPCIANNAFIFNPADENELLDEPKAIIKDYVIQSLPTTLSCPFTGQYVITLQKVDKISDIDVVVGESISNSKTQPSDIAINEAGEIAPDNQQSTTYNYGSYWRYNVSNLLMNHRMTITVSDEEQPDGIKTCFYITPNKNINDFYTTPLYKEFNNVMIKHEFRYDNNPSFPTYYFYDYDVNTDTFTALRRSLTLKANHMFSRTVVRKISSNYAEIQYDNSIPSQGRPGAIPGGCKILGSDLKNASNYAVVIIDEHDTVVFKNCNDATDGFAINDDVFYTGNYTMLRAKAVDTSHNLVNKTIVFNTYNTYILIKLDGTTYNVHTTDDPGVNFDILFEQQIDSKQFKPTGKKYILGQSITLDSGRKYKFISEINTGMIEEGTIVGVSANQTDDNTETDYVNKLKEPLQLTSYDVNGSYPADDDVLIKHVKDDDVSGLLIHTPKLTNKWYDVHKISGKDRYITYHENMTGYGGVESLVFIPKKSNVFIRPFNTTEVVNITPGLMVVEGLDGGSIDELNDETSALFLATGHDTLNVEPPQADDRKFKTFNGSLTFDRSSTRITRLFSMTNSNSCIGYINDILSAKLSRYYFVANYGIFNTFIDKAGTIPFGKSNNQTNGVYSAYKDNVYTGIHEILLANCGDIVKLIGSDVITNNCMPGITPEEHIISCQELKELNKLKETYEDKIEMSDFHYKLFHYYNSGFNHYPSIGGTNTNTNGITLLHVSKDILIEDDSGYTNAPDVSTSNCVFVSNDKRANNDFKYWNNVGGTINRYLDQCSTWKNNEYVAFNQKVLNGEEEEIEEPFGGIITVLPSPRIYRDNNFEQSDLTISTGRIKTLSPIYIQSVSRITLNNFAYVFDMMYNIIIKKYGSLSSDGQFDYLLVYTPGAITLSENEEGVMRRFGMNGFEGLSHAALSFDSVLMLNYLTSSSVNDYQGIEDMAGSLPTENNEDKNEEIIEDIITYRPETNIQLFSSRYFDFHENISSLSMVCWVQVINPSLELNNSNCWTYFGKYVGASNDDPSYPYMKNYIDVFYSNVLMNNNYNITRTVKALISKLGEFLDFPKIVFGSALNFNQSKTINIQYLNPVDYVSEFTTEYKVNDDNITKMIENYKANPKQKNNVALFGVVFKYHQLSLGWQQMINDFQNMFVIDRARGQKHFTVKIYDEFGRQIPNVDTSQGFKNNLRLEINCYINPEQ